MIYNTMIGEKEYLVQILDEHHVSVDGQVFEIDFHSVSDQPVYSMLVNGKSFEAHISQVESSWQVLLLGHLFTANVEDERERRLRLQNNSTVIEKAEFVLKSPMPGLIVSVHVEEGQNVVKGEVLVVLESMKMQNELRTPRDGTVTRLRIKPGDSLELNQVIMSVV